MPDSNGQNNTSFRKRITRMVLGIAALWLVLVIQLIAVGVTLWPQVYAQVEGVWQSTVIGSIDAVCGCDVVAAAANTTYTTTGLAIVLLAIVWAFFSLRRFRQYIRQTRMAQVRMQEIATGHVSQLHGVPITVIHDSAPQAVTIGWRSPVVYVSDSLIMQLTPFELLAVLQHEVSHAKHRDPMWRAGISVVLPFLGLRSRVIQQIEAWQEIAADEAANPTTLQQAFLRITSAPVLASVSSTESHISSNHFAMQSNAAVNVRLQHWLGEPITLGPIRWLIAAAIIGIIAVTTLQVVLASTESHQLVHSCLELQAMCEDVMSRPAMSSVLY